MNMKQIFLKNGYPLNLFENTVNLFLSKKFCTQSIKSNVADRNFEYILKIPYVGKPSFDFKNKMKKIILKDFDINIDVVFTSFKVGNYFSLKSYTPKALKSYFVYKFTCLADKTVFYIGKTHRHLCVRAMEHLDLKKGKTAITKHIKSCETCISGNIDYNHFEIFNQCKTKFECVIKEALFIKKLNPAINKQLHNSGSSFPLNVF